MQIVQLSSRQQWLEYRRTGVGASDVGAILGLSPYRDHLAVWADKTGRVPPQEPSMAMRLGSYLEPFIAAEFERVTGLRLEDPGDYSIYADADTPLFCTPDRLIRGTSTPVELKHVHPFRADDWREPWAPLDYQAQLQAQMHVLAADEGYLVGLVGNDLAVRRFGRNDRFVDLLVDRVREFWGFVARNEEPPARWHASIVRDGHRALHPQDNGDTVQLPVELLEIVQRWRDKQAELKRLEESVKQDTALIGAALGDAAYGEIGPYRLSYKTVTRPAHTVQASTYRVLRLVQPRKEDRA